MTVVRMRSSLLYMHVYKYKKGNQNYTYYVGCQNRKKIGYQLGEQNIYDNVTVCGGSCLIGGVYVKLQPLATAIIRCR